MAIRLRKDTADLIARTKLRGHGRRHYLFACLWRTREAMAANTDASSLALGCHCCTPTVVEVRPGKPDKYRPKPLLGEVHFIAGRWTTEIVAHELCHALLHRLATEGQGDLYAMEMDEGEEPVCYEFGQWFDQLYRWLWQIDKLAA